MNSKLKCSDISISNIGMVTEDTHKVHMTGESIDRIYRNGKLVDVIEGHNLVVNSFLKLVMALCSGNMSTGIKYWAVGNGDASWDSELPEPEINASRLTSEIGRVKISPSDITFLNGDDSISAIPTNILQIRHTFGVDDCNGEWREFGLFGGDDATESTNSGIIINKKHHSIITKTREMAIDRTMKFTLTIV